MAPEQAEDRAGPTVAADMYSLRCSLHLLVTGPEPFVGDNVLKRLMAHQLQPRRCATARPESEALEDAFQKMMATRPEDRPGRWPR